jgi:hypothetical protein
VPQGRAAGPLTVVIDTREKYGWKFANRLVTTERRALAAGDYGALVGETVIAVVERKSLANLATSLSDGVSPSRCNAWLNRASPPLWSRATTRPLPDAAGPGFLAG